MYQSVNTERKILSVYTERMTEGTIIGFKYTNPTTI